MEFRAASKDDVPQVVPMLLAQYALHSGWDPAKFGVREGFETGYARWLAARADDSDAVFLVATVEDSDNKAGVAGFLIGTVEEELPLYVVERYGFIHDLFVTERYRNEGLARQLVTLAMERFAAMGVRQVRCETAVANEAARGLFQKCGFRPATVTLLAEI